MTKNKLYKDIVLINKKFGGTIVRPSSLDFACDYGASRNIVKTVAHLLRAIVVDHPFDDYNKSTATIVARRLLKKGGFVVNVNKLRSLIKRMAIKSENSILKIEGGIRKCCQKKK